MLVELKRVSGTAAALRFSVEPYDWVGLAVLVIVSTWSALCATRNTPRCSRDSSRSRQGRSTHTGSCSCRSRRQSRGARRRSYSNRAAEIACYVQSGLQRPNEAQILGRHVWHYRWPCAPGCNRGSTAYTTLMENARPYIQENSFAPVVASHLILLQ